MDAPSRADVLPFVRFGLIVTGKGEEKFLPSLFRPPMASGHCTFEVLSRIGQRTHISSPKRLAKYGRQGKAIPDKDAEQIGLKSRNYLVKTPNSFVILVDDVEGPRAVQIDLEYRRYRDVFDRILGPYKHRASVHFLANMLEAYFFADAKAINAVLGTNLQDF